MHIVNKFQKSEVTMKKKKIAVFGFSANPPATHHRKIVELLIPHFDLVIVVPCGLRPDKLMTNDIPPIYRAVMTDMTFRGLRKVRVDLDDLEKSVFTRTIDLLDRYKKEGEVWIVAGADLVQGGGKGRSVIQREWKDGKKLWRTASFAVIPRQGYELHGNDLPPKHQVFGGGLSGSSTEIRNRVFNHRSVTGLVIPEVDSYIKRHGLYRGTLPVSFSQQISIDNPRIILVVNNWDPAARKIASLFQPLVDKKNPNCVVVIGGDGTMLDSIPGNWRRRLPFLGINTGHTGFLMNHIDKITDPKKLFKKLYLGNSPLLYVETISPDGHKRNGLAFNECHIRTINGARAGWSEIKINGKVWLEKLVSDGALVCTAAGSTAYAMSMGAIPLNVGSDSILLVGNNVSSPRWWKVSQLPSNSVVEMRAIDPKFRPFEAYADNDDSWGEIKMLRVRISKIAAVELASLLPWPKMQEKALQHQLQR